MRDEIKITNARVDYHRNGIMGWGFHVVLFDWDGRHMVATVMSDTQERGDYQVAVLDVDQLQAGNIEFARGNSWRGDNFADELYRVINEYEAQQSAYWDTDFEVAKPADVGLQPDD